MTHFHVILTQNIAFPMASITFDNYEDSLQSYVGLCTKFFGHCNKQGDWAIENAKAATGNGESWGAMAGSNALSIFWLRCDQVCVSPTWN